MADESVSVTQMGVRIERPRAETLGVQYYFMVWGSLIGIGVIVWLLVSEWLKLPLPEFLKLLSRF